MSANLKEFNAKNGLLAGTRSANYLQVLGATSGNAVAISALGTDTNIGITLTTKGSGVVNVGTATGTWTGSFGAISGAALTNLTAGNLSGTVSTSNGGTGLSSVGTSGQVLTSNGTTLSWATPASGLPTQSGNSGKYLTTDGTTASWASVSVGQNGLLTNTSTVSTSQNIGAGTNALSVGPITVANGATVTVAAGQRWVVI